MMLRIPIGMSDLVILFGPEESPTFTRAVKRAMRGSKA